MEMGLGKKIPGTELSKKIFRTVLKGVNELERNHIKSFEISKLNSHEAIFLQTHYLSGYNVRVGISKHTYKLTISKYWRNQRKY